MSPPKILIQLDSDPHPSVVRLLAKQGANIRVCSRLVERAQEVCQAIAPKMTDAQLTPLQCASTADAAAALDGAHILIAAGAAGVELVSADVRRSARSLK